MSFTEHQHQHIFPDPVRAMLYNIVDAFTLTVFSLVTLFPGQALAYADDLDFQNQPLVFVQDPSLMDRAIVGLEVFGPRKTKRVAQIIVSEYFEVRESLMQGSAVRVLSTAYSSTVDQTDSSPFITASGARVGHGVIAANFLPFGTKVRIGNQTYTVLDRMNARYDNKYIIDIWMPTRAEAIQHGARVLEMEIVALPK